MGLFSDECYVTDEKYIEIMNDARDLIEYKELEETFAVDALFYAKNADYIEPDRIAYLEWLVDVLRDEIGKMQH